MNSLNDLLLDKPLGDITMDILLFIIFTLHFIFVLFMLGTAMLGVFYFVRTWYAGKKEELSWFKEIIRSFMVHKSVAVVLGVGALLVIQVGYTVPFFTATGLFGGWWLLIIPILIIAFLSFDILGHKSNENNFLNLPFGTVSLALLLIVPGIFVAVLSTAERPDQWKTIIENGYAISQGHFVHWLFRYLHVIGAAIIFGGAYHYFFSTREEKEKKDKMLRWIILGIFWQVIFGVLLYGTVADEMDVIIYVFMVTGIISALIFLWIVISRGSTPQGLGAKQVVVMLLFILLPMLITRQLMQNKSFTPLNKQLKINREVYKPRPASFTKEMLNKYKSELKNVPDSGPVMYKSSCMFCHGETGKGNGKDAHYLGIPPENISQIKVEPEYFYSIVAKGVNGTAMPYFTYYLRSELSKLEKHLDDKFGIFGIPNEIPVELTPDEYNEGLRIYTETCFKCHGGDGRGGALAKGFTPSPPDLTRYTLQPERMFEVITNGYRGTMMVSFKDLPEKTKWGLVKYVQEMYTKNK